MSWGETECIHSFNCPHDCRMQTCNKNCPFYRPKQSLWQSTGTPLEDIEIAAERIRKETGLKPSFGNL